MSKLHIKKGDTVYVNTGESKGKTGRVLTVYVNALSLKESTWYHATPSPMQKLLREEF